MHKPRQTSIVVLITLAELAWLAAFGLLFAYRGAVGELEEVKKETKILPLLSNQLTTAQAEARLLQSQVAALSNFLKGTKPDDAISLLSAAAETNAKLERREQEMLGLRRTLEQRESELAQTRRELQAANQATAELRNVLEQRESELAQTRRELQAANQATAELRNVLEQRESELAQMRRELQAANQATAELQRKLGELEPSLSEIAKQYRDATNRVSESNAKLALAESNAIYLSNRIERLISEEITIRRELVGLPAGDLRRVIFVVDTSSSMRNSPAWNEARSLVRSWVEHLWVEECVLVNFNDQATVFPKEGYHRVRGQSGAPLAEPRKQLLEALDRARPGTFSDLLAALKVAYQRPPPDLLVLFTDGYPRVASSTDRRYANDILQEVARHENIPILSVAVGSYEVEGAGGPAERRNAAISFLKQLAARTGGAFLGR